MIKHTIKKIVFWLYEKYTKRLDFRDYKELARPFLASTISTKSGIQGNYCYGNIRAIKRAMGNAYDPHCMIEHGVYFGRNVLEDECLYPEISTIYTYSPYREEVLKEHFGSAFDKRIIAVGPYIIHAANHLNEKQRAEIKKLWGKTLLVFPSHSSPEGSTQFDYTAWIEEILRRSVGFDTIVISLFWLDIYNGNYEQYLDKGFVITCCGHRMDPNFLSRQKDLISLADMSMSNDIGTHIGYCISMGVPHYFFHQDVKFEANNDSDRDSDIISANRKREYRELFGLFSEFNDVITAEQEKAVKYYWGEY